MKCTVLVSLSLMINFLLAEDSFSVATGLLNIIWIACSPEIHACSYKESDFQTYQENVLHNVPYALHTITCEGYILQKLLKSYKLH